MKSRMWLAGALTALLWATPAKADSGVIVRTTLGLQGLQALCLLNSCTVAGALDGTLNQVFLLTTPLNPQTLVNVLRALPGIVNTEVDQVLNLVPVGALNQVPTPLPAGLLSGRTLVAYPLNSGTMVWDSYVNQPAAKIVKVSEAQSQFRVSGSGIVADIDTGVDPNHPALQGVLLAGYDFTRNQPGGSELNDVTKSDFPAYPPPTCSSATCPSPARVNQSTAAMLDQSTAAMLDGKVQYAAFGHGTMVMGVIHLVAPTAKLLPLKAFHSNGAGNLSDILRAIYYGVQNNANVISMSFDLKTSSSELKNALDYANQLNVICAASAGNDGQGPPLLVFPAALQNDVMGVASTSDLDTRSTFSNYGNSIVWVAAPGEAIVTTYPFSTYSAAWGTSFSAPFVSGSAALLRSLRTDMNESLAAPAVAHAQFVGADMGSGRLNLLMALAALPAGNVSPDYNVSAAPSSTTIAAGENTKFTVSAAPSGGFNQMVAWSCTGAPATATCSVSPASVTLDGTNAANVTVTLTTMARARLTPLVLPLSAPPLLRWKVLSVSVVWLLVSLMVYSFTRASNKRLWLSVSAVLVLAALCTSCGGGTSSGPPPIQGTPANTYTITVTGSSNNLSHATTFKLTVK
ncbi:MAG TPA: S8 family serine peptidase [Candidatus Dormibacteraeota bacterium]|nr:S8 family serine peptidase [Candidatus Dormibacteraeota bacterium]